MTTGTRAGGRQGYGLILVLLLATGCGGGGGSNNPPTAPTPPATTTAPTTTTAPPATTTAPPTNTATITITAAGVSPQSLTVSPGTRVTFVNNDTRTHEMNSDPHPTHEDCPPIDAVGFLAPGQSRQTGNLNTARTCGFHDHNQPDVRSLQGQIIVR